MAGDLRVTSGFGTRCDPVEGEAEKCVSESHEGVDLDARHRQEVYATGAGVIASSWFGGAGGNQVVLYQANGWAVGYAHLDERTVAKGQSVEAGDLIGYAGTTGRSTGTHLHLTLRPPSGGGHGAKVDPLPYLVELARAHGQATGVVFGAMKIVMGGVLVFGLGRALVGLLRRRGGQ